MNQRSTYLFTNKDEVVKDLLENMNIDTKAKIKHTLEDELIMLYLELGQYIRNRYRMWKNEELVRSTGKEHPEDASAVIIKAVWKILQESDESGLDDPPEPPEIHRNVFFQWHIDKECLEISCSRASIVIEHIDLDFAQVLADSMKANLTQTQTRYLNLEVAPKVTRSIPNVVVSLMKYPQYRDGGEIWRKILIEWIVNEQSLEFSCGGALIAINHIDLDFARAIAKGMRIGLREVERYTSADVAARVTHSKSSVTISLWDYPQRASNNPQPTKQLYDDQEKEAMKRAVKRFEKAMGKKPFDDE